MYDREFCNMFLTIVMEEVKAYCAERNSCKGCLFAIDDKWCKIGKPEAWKVGEDNEIN